MTDEFERELAQTLRSAGRSVAPSPTGYLHIRNKIEARVRRARRVARVAIGSMSVLVVAFIGILIATGNPGAPPIETAAPEEPGLPGYSPAVVPAGMQMVQVFDNQPGDEAESPEYVQVYRSVATDSRIIVRQRSAGAAQVTGAITVVTNAPLEAEISEQSNGSRVLRWTSESGRENEISSWGVSDEELLLFARSLGDEDDPDPTILPSDMTLVAQGNFAEPTADTKYRGFSLESEAGADHVSSIEVTIRTGDHVAFELLRAYTEQSEWVGEDKLLARTGEGELLVLWSPTPQILVETRSVGIAEADLLGFVDRLQPVGDDAWFDMAALAVLEEPLDGNRLAPRATISGLLDAESWSLSWPAEVIVITTSEDPEPSPEGVSEVEIPESDVTTTTQVELETDGEIQLESEPFPDLVDDDSTVTSTVTIEEVEPAQHCLGLTVSEQLVAEQCGIGTETQAWLFPALGRSLLVIYSATGDLLSSGSIEVTTAEATTIIDPDATAKGRVWLAWLDSKEVLAVTQYLGDGLQEELLLVQVDLDLEVADSLVIEPGFTLPR